MQRYEPNKIEPKWQEIWEKTGLYHASDTPQDKLYVIPMFPYPSGDGLHVGHPRPYTAADITARFHRYHGRDVLHATGWDAFGLPAENAAIKKGVHPAENTQQNIDNFRRQLKSLGISYDWTREVNTSDPGYYKWTQWIFIQLFKAGLAYRAKGWQWWCPNDKTVLANEQVVDGKCERCGAEVTKKELTQWYFKVTDYAGELIDNLEKLDWPESIKALQRNWIGRSEGSEVDFESEAGKLTVYTTRPDTLFGVTYIVLAPEHELVGKLTTKEQQSEVEAYVKKTLTMSEIDRATLDKEKTGVFTGSYALNPVNGEKIPIWVADYVLVSYGTGVVMAVPGHDQRDFDFSTKYDLPIPRVIDPLEGESGDLPLLGEGTMVNSDTYDGLPSAEARERIIVDLEKQKVGRAKEGFRLRDWLISRQRYWGTPIPIVHCPKDGPVAVPDDQLPVELPHVEDYLPTGDGRSPLAKVESFVKTKCPKCGGPAERETDTMDTFADSSWYFLRYPDVRYEQGAWNPQAVKNWAPVDVYVGGADHAVLHLIYARFWVMALADLGHLDFREPFLALRNHGMIQGEDGQKMSKSKGNVINPDEMIEGFGADTMRTYEMFIGPYDQSANWSAQGIEGVYRFLKRVWAFGQQLAQTPEAAPDQRDDIALTALSRSINTAIKNVTFSVERFRFNTGVSALMEALNEFTALKEEVGLEPAHEWRAAFSSYLVLLSVFAPHLAEELWSQLGNKESIFAGQWPQLDKRALAEDVVTVVVQVNGKVRGTLLVEANELEEKKVVELALQDENIKKYTSGSPKKVIYVPGKLLNLVV